MQHFKVYDAVTYREFLWCLNKFGSCTLLDVRTNHNDTLTSRNTIHLTNHTPSESGTTGTINYRCHSTLADHSLKSHSLSLQEACTCCELIHHPQSHPIMPKGCCARALAQCKASSHYNFPSAGFQLTVVLACSIIM